MREIGMLMMSLVLVVCSWAQVPRDTSYTLSSTVKKVQKNYPHLAIEGVKPAKFASVKTISNKPYKKLEARDLLANFFVPKKDQSRVGIVLIHGGGWRSGSPELMTPLAEKLAVFGYSVMVPEYRMSLEASYPAALVDLKDAIVWMKSNSEELEIDENKIVVMGCSAGGQLAALLGTTYHVQAIIDVDGIVAFKHPDSKEGSMAAQWLGGTYEEVPEVWEEAAALSHVSAKTAPTLFIGSRYPRFLAGHSEYMQTLNEAGTYTSIKIFENAPHSFWLLSPWFEPTVAIVLDFLNKVIEA